MPGVEFASFKIGLSLSDSSVHSLLNATFACHAKTPCIFFSVQHSTESWVNQSNYFDFAQFFANIGFVKVIWPNATLRMPLDWTVGTGHGVTDREPMNMPIFSPFPAAPSSNVASETRENSSYKENSKIPSTQQTACRCILSLTWSCVYCVYSVFFTLMFRVLADKSHSNTSRMPFT